MKHVLLALFLFVALTASAAPRLGTKDECTLLADMAVASRAIISEGVSEETTNKILRNIYVPSNENRPDIGDVMVKWETLMSLTIRAATVYKGTAGNFASLVQKTCMKQGGNVDSILGVDPQ